MGERGQTSSDYAGVLAVVAVIVAALAAVLPAGDVAAHVRRAVCTVAGGDCAAPRASLRDDGGGGEPAPSVPPEVLDIDVPVSVLPFPGSVSIACSYTAATAGPCGILDVPGVTVGASAEREIERTETRLDETGCPRQRLSVTTRLELDATSTVATPAAEGGLSVYTGAASTYAVTVSPDAAEALEDGGKAMPNPVDPRTIAAGEAVELSQEFYAGHELDGSYRALQAELGYEEGTRVSAGILRAGPGLVRIHVGDEDFVRNALSYGVGNDVAGVSLSAGGELSQGRLHSIDVDVSTPAGWDAYQRFLESGVLPEEGTPGTADPAEIEIGQVSDQLAIEGRLPGATVGGVLGESGGTVTVTTRADGSQEELAHGFVNDVGFAVGRDFSASGEPGPVRYSLLLEDVDDPGPWEILTGRPYPEDGNADLRVDFTDADLARIQEEAVDQIVHQTGLAGDALSEAEVRAILAEDPEDHRLAAYPETQDAIEIATAEEPHQVFEQLFRRGGSDMDSNTAINGLLSHYDHTLRARHGEDAQFGDHPDDPLPGELVTPSC